jgi:hypothetical protein
MKDIFCPYCGHKEKDAWDIDFGDGTEEETTVSCSHCDEEFICSRSVSVSYSTMRIRNGGRNDRRREKTKP